MSDAYRTISASSAALFSLLACSAAEQPVAGVGAAGQTNAPDSVVLAAGGGATAPQPPPTPLPQVPGLPQLPQMNAAGLAASLMGAPAR